MLTQEDLEKDIKATIDQESVLESKVKTMFSMQNELNLLIDSKWTDHEHWDFQRASMIELGELMDHYGYKWWKKQEPNLEQCQLEVIDIAHFHISHLIQSSIREGFSYDFYVKDFTNSLSIEIDYDNPEIIRKLIDECIFRAASKNFTTFCLAHLMKAFGIAPDDLCNKYIEKNTLNIFRAKHGYKSGTYIKTWNSKEDNEVLSQIAKELDSNSKDYANNLYEKLEDIYKQVA
jgi:dimeric dUTPase (all-alpha-NTP-PPase superfamily)